MDKYIKIDAVYNTLTEYYHHTTEYQHLALREALSRVPAADVAPVVRGHKITRHRPIAGYWASGKLDGGWNGMEGRVWVKPVMDNPVDYCSECGKRLDDTFQNYCPNCGARIL